MKGKRDQIMPKALDSYKCHLKNNLYGILHPLPTCERMAGLVTLTVPGCRPPLPSPALLTRMAPEVPTTDDPALTT